MRISSFFILLFLLLPATAQEPNPDPWEGFNRKMFAFNETMDKHLLKPAAQGYRAITPKPVDRSLGNFFSNFGDIKVLISDLAQLKLAQAASDTGRILVNTTLGFFGFFDVATRLGMPKHQEDFGQVLGYWGVGSGPYLMLPFLGPSTVRDISGTLVEYNYGVTLSALGENEWEGWGIVGVYGLQVRARLLDMEGMISGDRYTFIRSFYLQNREFLVRDGKIKDDFGDEEWEDDSEDSSAP